MSLKCKILLVLMVVVGLGGCSADEVPFRTMAWIIGRVALVFYVLALSSVFAGRVMRARRHIFNKYAAIAISVVVFVGFNALLLLVDPGIAAILFFLVLMCVVGLNLAFFLDRLWVILTGLFVFTVFLASIYLFETYRPLGVLGFLVKVFRWLR